MPVCQDRFLGKPKKTVETARVVEVSPEVEGTKGKAAEKGQEGFEAQLAALLDSQKALQDQIAALKAAF